MSATKADFIELGQLQRGAPEAAMLKVQHFIGGGVMSFCVEHIGDLMHRMNDRNTWDSAGYEYVKDKVEKTLRVLRSEYGFEREFEENLKNNAEYHKKDSVEFRAQAFKLLDQYAQAHAKLPVYNAAHKLCRAAAVNLGLRNFVACRLALGTLKEELRDLKTWVVFAREGLTESYKLPDSIWK